MSRLFLRIYVSVAIAIGVAIASFALLVSSGGPTVRSAEAAILVEERLGPLAEHLATVASHQRSQELWRAMSSTGPVMAILPWELLSLDSEQRARLERSEAVVIDDSFKLVVYVRLPGEESALEVWLLGHKTLRHQWSWAFDVSEHGRRIDPAVLSAADAIRVRYRPVVATIEGEDAIVGAGSDGTLRFVRPSISLREPAEIGPVLIMVLTALALVIVLRPIQRNLRRLGQATQQIAEGNLDVRVGLTGSDDIARLGQRFDRMAGKPQGLTPRQRGTSACGCARASDSDWSTLLRQRPPSRGRCSG